MVKTDDALKQKVFDLGLKVEVLKEKKQDGNKKSCFFSSQEFMPSVDK